ncbi:MAG: hypothetical protein JST22_08460 [Bacteroidetes bacterium]|nr:hypothetical protein [Bacteroidota bacterium]
MAQPRGAIGLVLANSASPLPTAMRALGIPFRALPLALIPKTDLSSYQILVVDELALDQDVGFAAYASMIDNVKQHGLTLLLLYQQTPTIVKATKALPFKLYPRDVEYRLSLTSPRHDDPVMTSPNTITTANLDSMSMRTHQLVHGGPDSRAIVSANLDNPDSSGVFVWEPRDRGAIWYIALPIAARAADGYEAEQKVLANFMSNK